MLFHSFTSNPRLSLSDTTKPKFLFLPAASAFPGGGGGVAAVGAGGGGIGQAILGMLEWMNEPHDCENGQCEDSSESCGESIDCTVHVYAFILNFPLHQRAI